MTPRTVLDRYELLEPLGSGVVGNVWKAHDRTTDLPVALKEIEPRLVSDDRLRQSVEQELRRLTSLSHSNIVDLRDFGNEGGTLWVVMEDLDGVTLAALLEGGPLPVARSARVVRQILAALDHLHDQDLVHGDLKPENVFISGDEEVRVADAGLVNSLDASRLALRGAGGFTRLGTYVAPEVHAGQAATPLSDIYSAGCVLYHALAGHPPFTEENPAALAEAHRRTKPLPIGEARADVGSGFEAIVMRALAKYPQDRFPSATHMDAAIENLGLDHEYDTAPAVVTHRMTERERVSDRPPVVASDEPDRMILWAVLGVVAALVIAFFVVFATTRPVPEPTPTPVVLETPPPQQPVIVPPPQPPVIIEQPAPTPIVITPEPTPEEEPPAEEEPAP